MLRKTALVSLAMALASMVLPVPGGPYSSTPFGARRSAPREKSSGREKGSTTMSLRRCFSSARPPMSSKVTSIDAGSTASREIMFSYLLVSTSVRCAPRA